MKANPIEIASRIMKISDINVISSESSDEPEIEQRARFINVDYRRPPPQPRRRDRLVHANNRVAETPWMNRSAGVLDMELMLWRSSGMQMQLNIPEPVTVPRFHFDLKSCAICGVRSISAGAERNILTLGDIDVRRLSVMGDGPCHSERGVRHPNGARLYLLSDIVMRDGCFWSCKKCDAQLRCGVLQIERQVDFGKISQLPQLSIAEKLCLEKVRICGRVVQFRLRAKEDSIQFVSLRGHTICFHQAPAEKLCEVFPNIDFRERLRVIVYASRNDISKAIVLLRHGPLVARPAVLAVWLRALSSNNALYRRVRIDLSDSRLAALDAALDEIANQVDVIDSAHANASRDSASEAGAVFVGGPRARNDAKGDVSALLRAFVVPAPSGVVNEYDEKNELLCGAFPWLFFFGDTFANQFRSAAEWNRYVMTYYDGRFQEPEFVFELENMQRRHVTAQRIARIKREKVVELNDLLSKNDLMRDVLSENPSSAGEAALKKIQGFLCAIERHVPFSHAEMRAALPKSIGLIRWKGYPSLWMTGAPSCSENKMVLRFCGCGVEQPFEIRTQAVLDNPVLATQFYDAVCLFIDQEIVKVPYCKKFADVGGAFPGQPGVFGRCTSYTRTTDEQSKKLLHFHSLYWTELNPEVIQQLMHKNLEAELRGVIQYFDRVCITKMSEGFWAYSNNLWKSGEEVVSPGLVNSENDVEKTNACVHKYLIHRKHRDGCWMSSKEHCNPLCRFGFPQPQTDETKQVNLVHMDGAIVQQSHSVAMCTHVLSNCACSEANFTHLKASVPLIEQSRPTKHDALLSAFNPDVLRAIWSNMNLCMLSSASQCGSIIMYQLKYQTREKNVLHHSVHAIEKALEKSAKNQREFSDRSLYNYLVNAASSREERSLQCAVLGLLRKKCWETNEKFVYIYPYDCLPCDRALTADVTDLQMGNGRTSPMSTSDLGVCIDAEYEDAFGDEEMRGETAGRLFIMPDGKALSCSQQQIYNWASEVLWEMPFLSFTLLYEVCPVKQSNQSYTTDVIVDVETDEEGGESEFESAAEQLDIDALSKVQFSKSSPLFGVFELRRRKAVVVPILAGRPPPLYPSGGDDASRKKLVLWSYYWSALLFPYRGLVAPRPRVAVFVAWFWSALRGEHGQLMKMYAKYVERVSMSSRSSPYVKEMLEKRRKRCADSKQTAKRNKWRASGVEAQLVETAEDCQEMQLVDEFANDAGFELEGQTFTEILVNKMFSEKEDLSELQLAIGALFPTPSAAPQLKLENYHCVSTYEDLQAEYLKIKNSISVAVIVDGDPSALNVGQRQIFNAAIDGDPKNAWMFVCGRAGVGKSFLAKSIVGEIQRRGLTIGAFSPTGTAAGNLMPGTLTLHSGFGIQRTKENLSFDARRLKSLCEKNSFSAPFDVVLVDEVSMVPAEMLDTVNRRVGEINHFFGKDSTLPFGGSRVIAIGDFAQIPPVAKRTLVADSMFKKPSAGGQLWRSFRTFFLTEQVRASDPLQARLVDQLYSGEISKEMIASIGFLNESCSEEFANGTFITATNVERNMINDRLCRRIASGIGTPVIKWRSEILSHVASSVATSTMDAYLEKTGLYTTFVPGVPCIVVVNTNTKINVANGTLGVFVAISGVNDEDRQKIGAAQPGEDVWIRQPDFVLVSLPLAEPSIGPERLPRLGGTRCFVLGQQQIEQEIGGKAVKVRGHGIEIALAITAHKSQAKTLDRAVICFPKKQRSKGMTFEQALVSLTRTRALANVKIFPPTTSTSLDYLFRLKPNADVKEWMCGRFVDGFRQYGCKKTRVAVAARIVNAPSPKVNKQAQPPVTRGRRIDQDGFGVERDVDQVLVPQERIQQFTPQGQIGRFCERPNGEAQRRQLDGQAQRASIEGILRESVAGRLCHEAMQLVLGAVNGYVDGSIFAGAWRDSTGVGIGVAARFQVIYTWAMVTGTHFLPVKIDQERRTITFTESISSRDKNVPLVVFRVNRRDSLHRISTVCGIVLGDVIFQTMEETSDSTEADSVLFAINSIRSWSSPGCQPYTKDEVLRVLHHLALSSQ